MGTPSRATVTRLVAGCLLLAMAWLAAAMAPGADARGKSRARVTIVKGPHQITGRTTARLRWRAGARTRGRCRLDRRRARRCGRRVTFRRLRAGRHRFRVTVRRGGRRVTASYVWRVKPRATANGRSKQRPRDAAPPLPPGPTAAPPAPGDVLWNAGMETGSLSEWYYPEAGPSGNFGGGEYNSGGGDSTASSGLSRSGGWSAKASLLTSSGGTRLFRWREPRAVRDLVFESWFYLPSSYTLTGDPSNGKFWDIFQFKSRATNGAIDPIWYLDLKNRADGSLYPTLIWWHRTLEGPHQGESGFKRYQPLQDVTVPIGRWFSVKSRLRQAKDFDGWVQFWLDDQLVFDQQGVRTSHANCAFNSWCASNEWSVNNYTDGLSPSQPQLYIDDARIYR